MKQFVLCAALAVGVVAPTACGAVISDRPTLQTILGGPGVVADFESFSVSAGTAIGLGGGCVLNAGATCNGQGPGLVPGGIEITFGSGGGQVDAVGYYGATSMELLSGSPAGQPLVVDFTDPVSAFGLDLRSFSGFAATAQVDLYTPDDSTLIGSISGIILPDTGLSVFFGYQDVGGIGRAVFTQSGQPWSPIIDNVEFGGAVGQIPEPGSIMLSALGLLGLAWLRTRR